MAKDKKRKTVEVDFSGVEGKGPLAPEGTHLYGVESCTLETSEDSGSDYLKWVFKGKEGAAKGRKVFFNTSLQPQALWNLKGLLEAMEVEVPDGAMDIDPADFDEDNEVMLTIEHDEYKGKPQARVIDYGPADGSEGERTDKALKDKKGKDEPEKLDKEKVEAFDDDEVKECAEEHDIDLSDQKTPKKRKAALLEALEEAGLFESEEKPAKGGKDKKEKTVKYDEDEVRKMDEKELKGLIKKHELAVDPDDFPNRVKLARAVAEKLGEEDLIA